MEEEYSARRERIMKYFVGVYIISHLLYLWLSVLESFKLRLECIKSN
ncbi:hypothetical protein SAMN05660297_02158 [Natronincola peptidivorans]|uniref:Uncharacterized protein n=1 Tax=Natronincola peptidivorans TaxID=426128 RepID=A0A1I0DVC0_9FIRM|nr:hypothetical protein SAMN05660297_02158 [Natronincola peptidivorans]